MNYYVAQVRTRSEEKFVSLFRALHPEVGARFVMHFPKRRLKVKRAGKVCASMKAIFPGYVFVEAEDADIRAHFRLFRRTDGFARFLRTNQDIRPMSGRELDLIKHFVKKVGPVAGASRVSFDENARIVVAEGPLLGLEGCIIKVDKRKGRAKVRLDLYGDTFAVDLAFEVLKEPLIK